MTGKVDVNGADAHPVFQQLTEVPDASGEAGPVRWNFEKWLVAPGGQVTRFRPQVVPEDEGLVSAIEGSLPS
jgi:glutathione peroxidase